MLLNQENDILTVDDLCEVLRIGKNAAYKLINSGKLIEHGRFLDKV